MACTGQHGICTLWHGLFVGISSGNRHMDETQLMDCLRDEGYKFVIKTPKGIMGMMPMMFTYGLFVNMDRWGYQYRYCFKDLQTALGAFKDWKAAHYDGDPGDFIVRKGLGPDLRGPASEDYIKPDEQETE